LAPRYLQASALEEAGDISGARRVLREALDVEPTSFTTKALIGDLELRAGNRTAAKAWYRRALALNPIDVGLQQLAR
jgi:predicted Zn-dependent protease